MCDETTNIRRAYHSGVRTDPRRRRRPSCLFPVRLGGRRSDAPYISGAAGPQAARNSSIPHGSRHATPARRPLRFPWFRDTAQPRSDHVEQSRRRPVHAQGPRWSPPRRAGAASRQAVIYEGRPPAFIRPGNCGLRQHGGHRSRSWPHRHELEAVSPPRSQDAFGSEGSHLRKLSCPLESHSMRS